MKSYKIIWHAYVDEETVIEGRSMVKAETEIEAARKLIVEKAHEYQLRQRLVIVDSIIEII